MMGGSIAEPPARRVQSRAHARRTAFGSVKADESFGGNVDEDLLRECDRAVRWVKKFFIDDEEPELGDERVRSGFLWLPKVVRGEIRWLVHATWRERYVRTRLGRGREVEAWRGIEWVDEEYRREMLDESSFSSHSVGLVKAIFRGGPYDGACRELHPDAASIELVSEVGSGQVQIETYKLIGREAGRLVLEHVETRTVERKRGR